MIITKTYAQYLIRAGRAVEKGEVSSRLDDTRYMMVYRPDKRRMDHYIINAKTPTGE